MSAEARSSGQRGSRDLHSVDTNLFVCTHDESAGRKREVTRGLIADLWESREGCASVQVPQEISVSLTRKVANLLPTREVATIMEDLSVWKIHTPGPPDVLLAAELHERTSVSWDVVILTSARSLDCRGLYSEDLNAKERLLSSKMVNVQSQQIVTERRQPIIVG